MTNNTKISMLYCITIFLLAGCVVFDEPISLSESGPLVPDAPQLATQPAEEAQVIEVIDGDTIRVKIDGDAFSVRYIGINTPERDEVCFEDATDANAAYVANQTVRLVRDESNTDRFGRLLRYVYVDEVLVNAELVAGGWAESRAYRPDTRLFEFMEALEHAAVRQQLGCHPSGIFR